MQLICMAQCCFLCKEWGVLGFGSFWLSLNEIGWCESVQNKWSGIDLNISPTCNQQSKSRTKRFCTVHCSFSYVHLYMHTFIVWSHAKWKYWTVLYFPCVLLIFPLESILLHIHCNKTSWSTATWEFIYILQVGVVLRLYVALTSGTLTSSL